MTSISAELPTVRVAVQSAMLAAGITALLSAAGFELRADAEVWVIDDSWLGDPGDLTGVGAVVTLGSVGWLDVLPELLGGGYALLPTDATPTELMAGVLGAAAGLAVLPPELVTVPTPGEDDPDDLSLSSPEVSLTPREKDVLNLLAGGLSNKRAARDLGVSESTVKFHVQAIYSKLGVQSRAGAVTRGIQLGLVSI